MSKLELPETSKLLIAELVATTEVLPLCLFSSISASVEALLNIPTRFPTETFAVPILVYAASELAYKGALTELNALVEALYSLTLKEAPVLGVDV